MHILCCEFRVARLEELDIEMAVIRLCLTKCHSRNRRGSPPTTYWRTNILMRMAPMYLSAAP